MISLLSSLMVDGSAKIRVNKGGGEISKDSPDKSERKSKLARHKKNGKKMTKKAETMVVILRSRFGNVTLKDLSKRDDQWRSPNLMGLKNVKLLNG